MYFCFFFGGFGCEWGGEVSGLCLLEFIFSIGGCDACNTFRSILKC